MEWKRSHLDRHRRLELVVVMMAAERREAAVQTRVGREGHALDHVHRPNPRQKAAEALISSQQTLRVTAGEAAGRP